MVAQQILPGNELDHYRKGRGVAAALAVSVLARVARRAAHFGVARTRKLAYTQPKVGTSGMAPNEA